MVWVVTLAWGVLAFADWGDRSQLSGILNIYILNILKMAWILPHFLNSASKEVLLLAIYSLRNAGLLGSLLPAKVPGLRHGKPKVQLWGFGIPSGCGSSRHLRQRTYFTRATCHSTAGSWRVKHGSPNLPTQVKRYSRSESELSGTRRFLSFSPDLE